MQPVRIRSAEGRPLIAGALREAFQVNKLVVEIDAAGSRASFEFGFAKSGNRLLDVDNLAADFEDGVHVVEVRIFGTPEARIPERACRGQQPLFAIRHVDRIAIEPRADLPAVVDDHCERRTVARSPESLRTSESTVMSAVFFAMSKLAACT